MKDRLAGRNKQDLGKLIAAGDKVNPLVRWTGHVVTDVLGGYVAAGDKHVDVAETGRAKGEAVDFRKAVAAEPQATEVRIAQAR
ncbi:MAG: hypothetical protein KatS3mg110_4431 [Pirellulaceae bacterium]|nr:MAG: hypothetical protein KatS3mg110_4431 [Pirellulaceae bacterium]